MDNWIRKKEKESVAVMITLFLYKTDKNCARCRQYIRCRIGRRLAHAPEICVRRRQKSRWVSNRHLNIFLNGTRHSIVSSAARAPGQHSIFTDAVRREKTQDWRLVGNIERVIRPRRLQYQPTGVCRDG
jgi:hypothetical protein